MFYDVFCELCAANNLTPSGGAAAIGFNRATVTTWKNTGKAPKGDILLKVAQYFEVPVDFLLQRPPFDYWEAINADTEAREAAKLEGRKYEPERLENGDTLKELLARGRYALFKSPDKWTASQLQRADMLFRLYPDLNEAYQLSQNLRAIFNRHSTKDSARLNLARWYNRVAESGFKSFNTIAATFYEHSDEILNFFENRSTNASAESINSKIKAFRAKLHGVNDTKFFIFRLCNIYA